VDSVQIEEDVANFVASGCGKHTARPIMRTIGCARRMYSLGASRQCVRLERGTVADYLLQTNDLQTINTIVNYVVVTCRQTGEKPPASVKEDWNRWMEQQEILR
jgi:hypothetical protein